MIIESARFEELNKDSFRIFMVSAEKCNLDKRNVVLVGASTRVPFEQKMKNSSTDPLARPGVQLASLAKGLHRCPLSMETAGGA